MFRAVHFVGFTDPQRYDNAVRVFGPPDLVHRYWDIRATVEIMEGDVVVFAKGDEHSTPTPYSWDDSNNTGDYDDVAEAEAEDGASL